METQDKTSKRLPRGRDTGLGEADLLVPGRSHGRGDRPSTSLSTCAPARLGSKLDLESITPGAFSLLFDLNILSPPASQPPASLLAVYPFPGSSLTPYSLSGARSSLEKSLISRPGGRTLHWPASPPLPPSTFFSWGQLPR